MANYALFLGKAPEIAVGDDAGATAAAHDAGLAQGADGYSGDPLIGAWYGNLGDNSARIFRNVTGWGPYFDYNSLSNTLTIGTTETITGQINPQTNEMTYELVPGSIGFNHLTENAVTEILARGRRHHYGYVSGFWNPNSNSLPVTGKWVAIATKPDDPNLNVESGNAYVFEGGQFKSAYTPADTTGMTNWDPNTEAPLADGTVLATANGTVAHEIVIISGDAYTFVDSKLSEAYTPADTTGMTSWNPNTEDAPADGTVLATANGSIPPSGGFVQNEVYDFTSGISVQVSDGVQLADLFELTGDADADGVITGDENPDRLYSFQRTANGEEWAPANTVLLDDVEQMIQDAIQVIQAALDAEKIWYINYNPRKGPKPGQPNAGVPLVSPTQTRTVKQQTTLSNRVYSWVTFDGGATWLN